MPPRIPDTPQPQAPMKTNETIARRQFLKETALLGVAAGVAPNLLGAESGAAASQFKGGKIRVAEIGCGSVSGSYLPNLTSQPFIEVVSVCDIKIERAKKRAAQFKVANVYPNIDEMLAGVPFDLLVNTTSMPSHGPVNKKALEAKRHVWTEKPMALDVKGARELLDMAKRNGVRLWAAPTCVTSPQFKFMVETMARGKIGRVTAGHGT